MAADDALIQAMCESCGQLCSNESFITVDHIPVICAVICVISLTKMNRIYKYRFFIVAMY